MIGLNSGLLGVRRVPTTATASGLWVPNEQVLAKRAGIWPASPVVPAVGEAFGGGFFAGYISHTSNGVATHALIVAPKATGASGTSYTISTNLAIKTSNTTTAGTTSTFDGAANTAAMVTAGIAAHPAANFCVGLSIGGFTDWYLPSRLELEIAYFNLKPTTDNNNTGQGANTYAVPSRGSNYTAGTPPRTSATAFQSGGAEAFTTNNHQTSTESSSTANWTIFFLSGVLGNGNSKTAQQAVRAFRKVAV